MHLPLEIPERGSRPFDLVGFGENSVDFVAVGDLGDGGGLPPKRELQRFERLPGGQIATAVAACARLGHRTRYVGTFGDDDLGQLSRESLRLEGVDTSASRVVAGARNRIAIILVDRRSGNRHVLWHRDSALEHGWDHAPLLEATTSGRMLLVDCEDIPAATLAARRSRQAGIPTMVDIDAVNQQQPDLLREIDIVVAAEHLPPALTGIGDLGKALEAMEQEYRPALLCVTLGDRGSLARTGGREIRTAAFRVPCVDTTGAGDVFRGALAAAILRNPRNSLENVLEYANAAAALNCRGLGARGGLPNAEEVDQLTLARGSL